MNQVADNLRFEPAHDAHAIEQVVFAVKLTNPLAKAEHAAASRAVVDRFGEDFPGKHELQSVQIRIGFGADAAGGSRSVEGGKSLQRTRTDGTLEYELRLERSAVTYISTAYTRWQAVWAQASQYFAVVLPAYLADNSIAAITLNYLDKFVWQGDPKLCRANRLLRPTSKYICPHVFDAPDLWHSHTGAFVDVDKATKRLINVNADCLDVAGPDDIVRRNITITTLFTDNLSPPEYDKFGITAQTAHSFVHRRMAELHAANKELFGDVVSDEICARIGLTD